MDSTPSSSPLVESQITPVAPSKLTPEQEEEIKLRSKYPNPQKPGGSSFIQKMLHKGNKKYFDSGDYNMAKSRCKANGNKIIQTTTINVDETSSSNSSLNDSPSSTTETCSNHHQSTINQTTPSTDHPHNTNIQMNVNNCPLNSPLTSNINIVNGQYPTSPAGNYLNVNPYSMSSSLSASNLMTQSLSQDKLSSIHLNTSLTNVILDSEEIGHGIPTPECIQSRKHSIAQSKLATPRLSSS